MLTFLLAWGALLGGFLIGTWWTGLKVAQLEALVQMYDNALSEMVGEQERQHRSAMRFVRDFCGLPVQPSPTLTDEESDQLWSSIMGDNPHET